MRTGNKHHRKLFSGKDIVIIALLLIVNISIVVYGKIRDKNYTEELLALYGTSTNKEQRATEAEVVLNKELKHKGVIIPRNSYLEKALSKGSFKGLILGNSLGHGIIENSKENIFNDTLATNIFSSINKLSKEALVPDNYSVGGSTIENTLSYIAGSEGGKSKAYECNGQVKL